MLNTTIVSQDKSNHSVKVEGDNRITIAKTNPKSKIIRVALNSEGLRWLLCDQPYLLDEQKIEYGEPYRRYFGDYERDVSTYVTHGVEILQVHTNNKDAYIEYIDRECEPKLYKSETTWCMPPKEEENVF